jgi:hypothetical protein
MLLATEGACSLKVLVVGCPPVRGTTYYLGGSQQHAIRAFLLPKILPIRY